MVKASRWLLNLLTFKKHPSNHQQQQQQQTSVKEKSRWSFVKSSTKHKRHISRDGGVFEDDEAMVIDPDKHAIAVAAATAAVAEAAVATAKAAAVVVKLTSISGRCDSSSYYGYGRFGGGGVRQRCGAAVIIQSAFRGYLAKKALKALKALVRLQALVRGHIARKQTAEQVRQMQALLRVQARARAGRVLRSESPQSSSRSSNQHHDPQTPEKSEEVRSRSPRRNQPSPLKRKTSKTDSRSTTVRQIRGTNRANSHGINDRVWDPLMQSCPSNDQTADKILEVDPGKPYPTSKQKNLFHRSHHTWGLDHQSHSLTNHSAIFQVAPCSNPYEALPLTPINTTCVLQDASFCTAENSPQFFSASSVGGGSSRRGPFTPTKSDSFHSYLSGYSDYPNYMCYTESSKAKLRSMSAPKQRPQYERSSSTKKQPYQAVSDSKPGSEKLSASYSSFTSKAYTRSGRLDNLGMRVTRSNSNSYGSSYGPI